VRRVPAPGDVFRDGEIPGRRLRAAEEGTELAQDTSGAARSPTAMTAMARNVAKTEWKKSGRNGIAAGSR
jgi:hypothetical protein